MLMHAHHAGAELQLLMRLHGAPRLAGSGEVQGGLLLPFRAHAVGADRARVVPRGLLLPRGRVQAHGVRLRAQVPGGVVGAGQVPAALLLPGDAQRQHDAVPDRLRVRPARHVRADGVPAGDVRVVRGEEVVRRVPRGALLPERHVVGAVPEGVVLPEWGVGAGGVPRGPVLPAGLGGAPGLPARDDVRLRGGTAGRLCLFALRLRLSREGVGRGRSDAPWLRGRSSSQFSLVVLGSMRGLTGGWEWKYFI